jgi:polysaccharide export outer membrane protein
MGMATPDTKDMEQRMVMTVKTTDNKFVSTALLCAVLIFLLESHDPPGYAQTSAAASSPAVSTAPAPPSLPISFGDLIQVAVFDNPDLSGPLRVNQNGEVVLPLGGAVKVKGLTAAQAGVAIAARLKESGVLLDPHVTVLIAEYQSQGVTVTGEVRSPGVYPLLTNRTVMDMIALAGGLNENAGKVASVFHRDNPNDVRQVRLNVSVQTPQSIAESNFELLPGDTISVSRSGVIYIIGDVGRPGGFLVEHNDRLSVVQALALAQGANQTAAMSKSQLMRKTDAGRLQYQIDLKKILAGRGADPLMADGDILYVPVSYKKVYSLRAIEAIIGLGSQVAVYRSQQ